MRQVQLVTTTSNIEGWNIDRYLGVITYQIVIGANLFKDVFASWRDVFGGNVKSYQRELEKMEEIALDELKKKASQKGGNIIIGLRLDFDEISGGGKSMFMLSASGTAVKAISQNNVTAERYEDKVSFEQLDFEKNRIKIIDELNEEKFKVDSIEVVADLTKYKIEAVKQVGNFLNNYSSDHFENNKMIFIEYFSTVSNKSISSFVKRNGFLTMSSFAFQKLVKIFDEIKWFDFEVCEYLLNLDNTEAHQRAIYLLELDKSNYIIDDVKLLKNISDQIKKTYSGYPRIIDSKGVFGKEKQKWECPNCKVQNLVELDTCSSGCGSNKYGFIKPRVNPFQLSEELLLEAKTLENILSGT